MPKFVGNKMLLTKSEVSEISVFVLSMHAKIYGLPMTGIVNTIINDFAKSYPVTRGIWFQLDTENPDNLGNIAMYVEKTLQRIERIEVIQEDKPNIEMNIKALLLNN